MSKKRDYCSNAPDWLPYCGAIREACKRHDEDYAEGGTMIALVSNFDILCRLAADIRLRDSIQDCAKKKAAETPGWPFVFHRMFHRVMGFAFSWAYFIAVRICGRSPKHWRYR